MSMLPENHLLTDSLWAMRHLPPGAYLPTPAVSEERQLLTDLLSLPDDADVDQWLRTERGLLIAHITLRRTLQHLKALILGAQRAEREGVDTSAAHHAELGGLTHVPDDAAPFVALDRNPDASPDLLWEVLRQLRLLREEPVGDLSAAPTDNSIRQQLLLPSELLRLDDTVNPVHWLQQARGSLTAIVALTSVLEQSRPRPTRNVGTVIEQRWPRQGLRATNGEIAVRVTVDAIVYGRGGFLLQMRARIHDRQTPLLARTQRRLLQWLGFNRVVDNLGNRYLLKRSVSDADIFMGQSRQTRQNIEMVFYPAVAPEAATLTFSSRPAVFTGMGFPAEKAIVSQWARGNLAWQTMVPALETRG